MSERDYQMHVIVEDRHWNLWAKMRRDRAGFCAPSLDGNWAIFAVHGIDINQEYDEGIAMKIADLMEPLKRQDPLGWMCTVYYFEATPEPIPPTVKKKAEQIGVTENTLRKYKNNVMRWVEENVR